MTSCQWKDNATLDANTMFREIHWETVFVHLTVPVHQLKSPWIFWREFVKVIIRPHPYSYSPFGASPGHTVEREFVETATSLCVGNLKEKSLLAGGLRNCCRGLNWQIFSLLLIIVELWALKSLHFKGHILLLNVYSRETFHDSLMELNLLLVKLCKSNLLLKLLKQIIPFTSAVAFPPICC